MVSAIAAVVPNDAVANTIAASKVFFMSKPLKRTAASCSLVVQESGDFNVPKACSKSHEPHGSVRFYWEMFC
jgi:hypothetical protein